MVCYVQTPGAVTMLQNGTLDALPGLLLLDAAADPCAFDTSAPVRCRVAAPSIARASTASAAGRAARWSTPGLALCTLAAAGSALCVSPSISAPPGLLLTFLRLSGCGVGGAISFAPVMLLFARTDASTSSGAAVASAAVPGLLPP